MQKAGAQGQRHEDLKFVCVDLDRENFGVLDGVGSRQREIVFVRENGNHFLEIISCRCFLLKLLWRWSYLGTRTWPPYEHKGAEPRKLHG